VWDGPTIIAAVIGGLGLLIATVSLGWQIRSARLDRQTRLRVSLTRSAVWSTRSPPDELLVVTAVNESSHPVQVTKVGLDYDTKGRAGISGSWGWDNPPAEGTIPGHIEGGGTGITTTALRVGVRYIGFVDDDIELRAYVYTADGSRFESEWHTPDGVPAAVHLAQIPVSESVRQLIASPPFPPPPTLDDAPNERRPDVP
jgi:hypothetical protein